MPWINLQPWRQRQRYVCLFMIYGSCLPVMALICGIQPMILHHLNARNNDLTQRNQRLEDATDMINTRYQRNHCDADLLFRQHQHDITRQLTLQQSIEKLLMQLPTLTPPSLQITQLMIKDQQLEWQLQALHPQDISGYRQRLQQLPFVTHISTTRLQQSDNTSLHYQATLTAELTGDDAS